MISVKIPLKILIEKGFVINSVAPGSMASFLSSRLEDVEY